MMNGSNEIVAEKKEADVAHSGSWKTDGGGPPAQRPATNSSSIVAGEGRTVLSAADPPPSGVHPAETVPTVPNSDDHYGDLNLRNYFTNDSSQRSVVFTTQEVHNCGTWSSSSNSSTPHGSPDRQQAPAPAPPDASFNPQASLNSIQGILHSGDGAERGKRRRRSLLLRPPRSPKKPPSTTAANLAYEVTRNELDAETDLMRSLNETDPLRSNSGLSDAVLSEVPIDATDGIAHDFSVVDDDDGLVLPVGSSIRTSTINDPGGDATSRRDHESIASHSVASKKKPPAPRGHQRHNRILTLEENIFGLNKALSMLKMEDQAERKDAENLFTDQRTDSEPKPAARTGDGFDKAGDIFDRVTKTNVSLTRRPEERRRMSQERLSDRTNATPGPSLNPMESLRATSSIIKKTDGDLVSPSLKQVVVDIEGGDMELHDSDGPKFYAEGRQGNPDVKRTSKWHEKNNKFGHLPFSTKIKSDWDTFSAFFTARKHTLYTSLKLVLLSIMLPSLGIAAILFYWSDNPPTGRCPWEGCNPRQEFASVSWWFLFIGCREVVILVLAKGMELFLVDLIALRTTWTLQLFGPMITLLLVQWKGWPMLVFFMGLFNFILVAGDGNFANHWLYWQHWIDLMNRSNPQGYVTSKQTYYTVCEVAMIVGTAVAIKRLLIGLYFGRKMYGKRKRS